MNFSPEFLDEIRTRISVSEVVARRVKLQRRGREFVGLSPFNPEKTPSFTVNDQKGFYHCFSSGKHGSIFDFVMETEGLSFPEAVEKLAGEAGIPMPERRPEDIEQEKQRLGLYDILDEAARFFQTRLQGKESEKARSYLRERGLSPLIQERFGIGYAPAGRQVLKQHFTDKKIPLPLLIEAGLLVGGEDIPDPYDRFRDRIMFPITNIKGQVIAFGGRALNPDVPAKYLNSPETPVFHKGAILFNHAEARKSAHDKQSLIVTEGYMDVIALASAGFDNTVAPLGTALTERQLHLLWRMAPEPVLCFDGDKAGIKAAWRAIDLALPELKPGFSLRFALLPEGLDPDDLIRQHGKSAMEEILNKAVPMADMLWSREVRAGTWDTPERRAALERKVEERLESITDQKIRHFYQSDLRARLKNLWAGSSGSRAQAQKRRGRNSPASEYWTRSRQKRDTNDGSAKLKLSAVGRKSNFQGAALAAREAFLILSVIDHPQILETHAEELAGIDLTSDELDSLRLSILDAVSLNENLDRAQIIAQLADRGYGSALERLDRIRKHTSRPAVDTAPTCGIETTWLQAAALHRRHLALERELKAAERECSLELTEENEARLIEIREQLNSLEGLEASSDEQEI